jgi:hypothetical protein
VFLSSIGANDIGAYSAFVGTVVVLLGIFANQVRKWREERIAEEDAEQKVIMTLFGSEESPPYPAVDGLVKRHEQTKKSVDALSERVASVEKSIVEVQCSVNKLVERTEPNGGSSIKDQLNRIENFLGTAIHKEPDE